MNPTQISHSDPTLTAIAAYLAGDIAGVQAAFAPITALLSDVLSDVAMPSSECSPCYEEPTTTIDMTCAPTMVAP
jgi:hypothetical protein